MLKIILVKCNMYDTGHSDCIGFRGKVIGGAARCEFLAVVRSFTSDRILSLIDCLNSYRRFDHLDEGTLRFNPFTG